MWGAEWQKNNRVVFTRNVFLLTMNWIGLDLFNDDTRPSGHITSRPTQVNVSQNCFHSLNNYSSPIILSSLGAS